MCNSNIIQVVCDARARQMNDDGNIGNTVSEGKVTQAIRDSVVKGNKQLNEQPGRYGYHLPEPLLAVLPVLSLAARLNARSMDRTWI